MPTTARKKHKIGTGGPWGSGLLLLGIGVPLQGIGYVASSPGRLPDALAELSQVVPPWAWGVLWIAAGLWSVWQALTPPQRPSDVLPAVGVLLIWSAAYLVYWLIQGIDGEWTRSWSSAAAWGMLAGFVACAGRCVNPPTTVRRR